MRVQSMEEALRRANDREPLARDSPFLYHNEPKWLNMAKGGQEEKDYYTKIYKSLTPLQQRVINQHAADMRKSARERNTLWNRIKATQTYHLLASSAELGYNLLMILAGGPFAIMTRPLQMTYVTVWFGTIYAFLFVANIAFLAAHLMGLGKLIKTISNAQAEGWSPINWLDINLFNRKKKIVANAREALSSQLEECLINKHQKTRPELMGLAHQKPLEFNVDVARTILLMCSIVYERDVDFVQRAACASISKTTEDGEPNEGTLFLLKSEEAMFRIASEWNLKFVSMADFRSLNGPFAGAFYSYENLEANDNPFIVVVMKGTSPDDFAEWLLDCACKFESCGDFLGDGLAHSGFYNALFPSKDSGARTLPYMRIIETVKMIAQEAYAETGGKKTNLFIGGHSLGAGIAQLLYARLLESPGDLGDNVVLRDGYMYGTPRACDFKLANRVDYNLTKPENYRRSLWRISNRAESDYCGDVVTRVPPGFADDRAARSALQDGSYYAYAAIGTRVDLTDAPIGYSVEVVKMTDEAENEFVKARQQSKYFFPQDIVQFSMWVVTVLVPILHDHFPASYMDSLSRVQARTTLGAKKLPQKNEQGKVNVHNQKSLEGNTAPTGLLLNKAP